MILSDLEEDILGEMQHDTYELWEWYSLIRTNYPSRSDDEIIELGNDLLKVWADRGWLFFYRSRNISSVLASDEALLQIKSMKEAATKPECAILVLELSPKAKEDVSWLNPIDIVGP